MTSATIFLFLAFVFTVANRLYAKHALNKLDIFSTTLLSQIFCAIVLFPFFIIKIQTVDSLPFSSVLLIVILGLLWTIASWVGNASVAMNDFSFKEIIRQTRVLWVVLAGIFLLNEKLSLSDILGITCIIASVFIVSYKRISFRDHISSKPVLIAWFSGFIVAGITILEKMVVTKVPVILYAFSSFFLTSVCLSLFLQRERREKIRTTFLCHKKELCIFSMLMLGAYCTGLFAYQLLPISIAYPVIQSSTIFGVLIGSRIFEQNAHVKQKLFAACIAVCGVLIIQLV